MPQLDYSQLLFPATVYWRSSWEWATDTALEPTNWDRVSNRYMAHSEILTAMNLNKDQKLVQSIEEKKYVKFISKNVPAMSTTEFHSNVLLYCYFVAEQGNQHLIFKPLSHTIRIDTLGDASTITIDPEVDSNRKTATAICLREVKDVPHAKEPAYR